MIGPAGEDVRKEHSVPLHGRVGSCWWLPVARSGRAGRVPRSVSRTSLSGLVALRAAAGGSGGVPGRSWARGSVAAVRRVGGQPLCREFVGGGLARGVARDGGEELFPAKGEGT
jgi:hypothetical protein